MKRKSPDNNNKEAAEKSLPNKSVRSYSNQKYEIYNLKKNKLKLWPLKKNNYGTLKSIGEFPIKVNLEAGDDFKVDQIKLYEIPNFCHGGLVFCGDSVGTEKDKETTIGDLKLRWNDVRARAVEIDRVTVGVGNIMISLCEEIIEGDIFENEGADITMLTDTTGTVRIAMDADSKKEYLPGEIKWLTGIHEKLLMSHTKIWDFYGQCGIEKNDISFQYSKDFKRNSQWLEIEVSAAKEQRENSWRQERQRATTTFSITKTKGKPLEWEFTRDVAPSSALVLHLKGQTDWIQGFPPLKPNFTAVPIEIDDIGWPEPTTDLEVWQRSAYNPKWDPSFPFKASPAGDIHSDGYGDVFYNTSSSSDEGE